MIESTSPVVYLIPDVNFARLEEEIARLNKRAEKLKLKTIEFKVVNTTTETKVDDTLGFSYQRVIYHCTIQGEAPKLAGWSLIAAIEPTEAGNLIREVPNEICPPQFRTTGMNCDHCQKVTRRKSVFVLRNTTGEYKQVGRQCLQDFLGGVSPETLINQAQYVMNYASMLGEADDDGWGSGGKTESRVPIHHFVTMVNVLIRRYGWVAKSKAEPGQQPTASLAWQLCVQPQPKWAKQEKLIAEEQDSQLASKSIEWVRNLSESNLTSTYIHDLHVSCKLDTVTSRTCGYVASVINAYLRSQSEQIKANSPLDHPSEFLGVLQERSTFSDLKIVELQPITGMFPKTKVKFEDPQGNILIWWASGQPNWLEVGKKVTVTGKVKKHDLFRNVKQTTLDRVKEEVLSHGISNTD